MTSSVLETGPEGRCCFSPIDSGDGEKDRKRIGNIYRIYSKHSQKDIYKLQWSTIYNVHKHTLTHTDIWQTQAKQSLVASHWDYRATVETKLQAGCLPRWHLEWDLWVSTDPSQGDKRRFSLAVGVKAQATWPWYDCQHGSSWYDLLGNICNSSSCHFMSSRSAFINVIWKLHANSISTEILEVAMTFTLTIAYYCIPVVPHKAVAEVSE